ncbi:MAG TPA: hypothetical protein VFZ61_11130 [Polyangiales bacterium]
MCAASLWSCAPSDFDTFTTGTSEEPSTCETRRCQDAGSGLDVDADVDADVDGAEDAAAEAGAQPSDSADSATLDVAVTPLDASPHDADHEAQDGAGSDAQDAARDAADAAPDIGPCDGSLPVCMPNRVEPGMEPCGLCKSGKRQRSRTCAVDGCSWGAWSAWSGCEGEHVECDPNAPAPTQSVPCTTCGARTQARTCAPATCTWEPWKDVSACSWCDACSEVVYCDTPSNIANRGTWCRQKACSQPQALANCMEDAQSVCGGITQPFFMEYL